MGIGYISKSQTATVSYYRAMAKIYETHVQYSPVVDATSLRLIIFLAVQMDLEIHQMDVETAYLYGTLTEEILNVHLILQSLFFLIFFKTEEVLGRLDLNFNLSLLTQVPNQKIYILVRYCYSLLYKFSFLFILLYLW